MRNNHCFIVGNLGSDPAERGRSAKGAVVGFAIAENVQAFDENTKTYKTVHTNWFQVTSFGSIAERAKLHLKKGDRISVQGRMKVSKYTDKSGEEKNGFEIIAEEIALWKSLPGAGAQGSSQAASQATDEEPLPF